MAAADAGKKGKDAARSSGGVYVYPALALLVLILALGAQYFEVSFSDLPWAASTPGTPVEPREIEVFDPQGQLTYKGVRVDHVEHFQNIFYAHDTSGIGRFAPPRPLKPPPGSVIDATVAGAWCPQAMGDSPLPFVSRITNTSENCLSVRVARPENVPAGAKLPVVVWLHGGGHILGSASDIFYAPDGFVQQSVAIDKPTIFVGVNSRLGIFGYPNTKALKHARHTNVGLKDQRAAFEWVRDNIAVFGGDPDRVTAMGQSVGALAIGLHLTSFGGKKGVPFQKAIMMSGATGLSFNANNDYVADNTAAVFKAVGCGNLDPFSELGCVRKVPMEKLMNTSVRMMREARPPFGELWFSPIQDDDFIPDRPSELMRRGEFVRDVSVIGSWTTNDGAWYALPDITTDEQVTKPVITAMQGLKEDSLKRLLYLYPLSDFEHLTTPESPATAQYYRTAQMNRDLWFSCPVIDFTWQFARQTGLSYTRIYEMNQTRFAPVLDNMGVPFWKAVHLSDIPYVFNTKELGAGVDNSAQQRKLAAAISSQFIDFVNEAGPPSDVKAKSLEDWIPAHAGAAKADLWSDFPPVINVNVLGGPYGSGVASVSRSTKPKTPAEAAVSWEKLFERCDFINSAKVRREIGA